MTISRTIFTSPGIALVVASAAALVFAQDPVQDKHVPTHNASPQDVHAVWLRAMREGQSEMAWECLTPSMRDVLTFDLFTFGELGGERERAFIKQHVRANINEQELATARERRPNQTPTEADIRAEVLGTLKDKKSFFIAGYAFFTRSEKDARATKQTIPKLNVITQGNWARGSHLRSTSERENIDFILTPAGWRIDGIWTERVPDPARATNYVKPKQIGFATPEEVFAAYSQARLASDWATCWSCLTTQLQEQAAYQAICDLSGHDPHFGKIYIVPGFLKPDATLAPADQQRQLLAGLRDKFSCYDAARSFQVGIADDEWKEPLQRVVVNGTRASGVVARTIAGTRRDGGVTSTTQETIDSPVYLQKTSSGWLLDLAPPE